LKVVGGRSAFGRQALRNSFPTFFLIEAALALLHHLANGFCSVRARAPYRPPHAAFLGELLDGSA
jgi:hypothetical protein